MHLGSVDRYLEINTAVEQDLDYWLVGFFGLWFFGSYGLGLWLLWPTVQKRQRW